MDIVDSNYENNTSINIREKIIVKKLQKRNPSYGKIRRVFLLKLCSIMQIQAAPEPYSRRCRRKC